MVIGGGKTKALRNQRRRKQRRKAGGPGQTPAAKGGKLGNLLRRIFALGGRRGEGR